VKSKVSLAQASSEETVLPERIQEALGQLVGAAKEGLLALSVGVGLGVLAELLEEEVDEVVGPNCYLLRRRRKPSHHPLDLRKIKCYSLVQGGVFAAGLQPGKRQAMSQHTVGSIQNRFVLPRCSRSR